MSRLLTLTNQFLDNRFALYNGGRGGVDAEDRRRVANLVEFIREGKAWVKYREKVAAFEEQQKASSISKTKPPVFDAKLPRCVNYLDIPMQASQTPEAVW